ncbi:concanavalin A-like lectin/glucanase domain-containing protein [Mycena polygramma]|nr:concanavalin A-like lectin/glucanase domain-containing protein [Mycena polygramma]
MFQFSSLVAAGPCDIYAAGGTPCVAAHSTTRALFSNYSGNLYQVVRVDGASRAASPTRAPVTLNGQSAYGVLISPTAGYRNDASNGIGLGKNDAIGAALTRTGAALTRIDARWLCH